MVQQALLQEMTLLGEIEFADRPGKSNAKVMAECLDAHPFRFVMFSAGLVLAGRNAVRNPDKVLNVFILAPALTRGS